MTNAMDEPSRTRALAMAEALAKAGIENDAPEPSPNPDEAARVAYLLWFDYLKMKDWMQLRRDVMDGHIPRIVRYRKLAVACREALRHRAVPQEMIEPITYAWGYYEALSREQKRAVQASAEA